MIAIKSNQGAIHGALLKMQVYVIKLKIYQPIKKYKTALCSASLHNYFCTKIANFSSFQILFLLGPLKNEVILLNLLAFLLYFFPFFFISIYQFLKTNKMHILNLYFRRSVNLLVLIQYERSVNFKMSFWCHQKTNEIFLRIYALASKKRPNKKNKGILYHK